MGLQYSHSGSYKSDYGLRHYISHLFHMFLGKDHDIFEMSNFFLKNSLRVQHIQGDSWVGFQYNFANMNRLQRYLLCGIVHKLHTERVDRDQGQ